MSEPFVIAVAVQNDQSCRRAVDFAVSLSKKLIAFKLYFVYVVPTNPDTSLPIIDRLEKSYNMEVHEEGKKDMRDLLEYLDKVTGDNMDYEFVKLEKESSKESILLEFVETRTPDLFVVGSHRQSALKKYVG
jgi:nucleotide-binding universal stress UspA family protein